MLRKAEPAEPFFFWGGRTAGFSTDACGYLRMPTGAYGSLRVPVHVYGPVGAYLLLWIEWYSMIFLRPQNHICRIPVNPWRRSLQIIPRSVHRLDMIMVLAWLVPNPFATFLEFGFSANGFQAAPVQIHSPASAPQSWRMHAPRWIVAKSFHDFRDFGFMPRGLQIKCVQLLSPAYDSWSLFLLSTSGDWRQNLRGISNIARMLARTCAFCSQIPRCIIGGFCDKMCSFMLQVFLQWLCTSA